LDFLTSASGGNIRVKGSLAPLFSIEFSLNDTLIDLKTILFTQPNTVLSTIPSPSHLRIRKLTRGDGLDRIIADDNLTLKKYGISGDKRLAVQLLTEGECKLSQYTMLLRACIALPKNLGANVIVDGNGVAFGPRPLPEIVFDGGPHPQLNHLQDCLARLTGLTKTHLAVAKWYSKGHWQLLLDYPPKEEKKEKKRRGREGGGKGGEGGERTKGEGEEKEKGREKSRKSNSTK